jgi:hypothetical protein
VGVLDLGITRWIRTPPEIHELLGGELLDDDATEEVGTQSSQALANPS